MTEKHPTLLPKMQRQLNLMGENIKLARLRRKFTSQQVAERAGISLECLLNVENGASDISIGIYTLVLRVLNLENDIYEIAKNDILGRKLQDIQLLKNENDLK
jgi:transcriptional regulator with XRE-family HTH domain